MDYSALPSDFPHVGDLDVFDAIDVPWPASSSSSSTTPRYPDSQYASSSSAGWYRSMSPKWGTYNSGKCAATSHHYHKLNTASLWDALLPPYGPEADSPHVPQIYMPELEFPPSPSDTASSSSTDISLSPSPPVRTIHVVCNAPLVAPIPLPYHSPTFLEFELPDIDEDLSHPPYTRRTSKRKHDAEIAATEPVAQKRRLVDPGRASNVRSRGSGYNRHHAAVPKHMRSLRLYSRK